MWLIGMPLIVSHIWTYALAICDWKILQLVAKQQYCDYHKSFLKINK